MHSRRCLTQPLFILLSVYVLSPLLSGCTVVGPTAVHSGRLAYNEAIIKTDNQQMLMLVVRNRYGERSNLLAVSSVTANVSVTANAGVELDIGDNDNYSGNLVQSLRPPSCPRYGDDRCGMTCNT